jgi:hypothetical protein
MPLKNSRMPLSRNGEVLCALLAILWGVSLGQGFAQISNDRSNT